MHNVFHGHRYLHAHTRKVNEAFDTMGNFLFFLVDDFRARRIRYSPNECNTINAPDGPFVSLRCKLNARERERKLPAAATESTSRNVCHQFYHQAKWENIKI